MRRFAPLLVPAVLLIGVIYLVAQDRQEPVPLLLVQPQIQMQQPMHAVDGREADSSFIVRST